MTSLHLPSFHRNEFSTCTYIQIISGSSLAMHKCIIRYKHATVYREVFLQIQGHCRGTCSKLVAMGGTVNAACRTHISTHVESYWRIVRSLAHVHSLHKQILPPTEHAELEPSLRPTPIASACLPVCLCLCSVHQICSPVML